MWKPALALLSCLLAAAAAPAQTLQFVTAPFAPYVEVRGGRAAGPLVDVLQAACGQLGWHCGVEVKPWRRALDMAQRGSVDGVFTIVDSPARREHFHLAAPVTEARFAFFARDGSTLRFNGERGQLDGRTIGAYGPSATSDTLAELVRGLAQVRVVIESDNRTALRKLAAGRYGEQGLALVNEAAARRILAEEDLTGLVPVGIARTVGYTIGLSRERVKPAQARQFARVLEELCRNGRLRAILGPHGLSPAPCARADLQPGG